MAELKMIRSMQIRVNLRTATYGRHFFFQAEDGIRDTSVTGVQTCALPISTPAAPAPFQTSPRSDLWDGKAALRSEERRVGNESIAQAWKRLEKILRQLREEELRRLLPKLEGRCQRMLDMQIEVHHGKLAVA